MEIPIKLLDAGAKVPVRGRDGDAAYDLYALGSHDVMPGQRVLVRTGIAMAIPRGFYGRIAERSGLALKQGVEIGGGVVDSNYRGDVSAIVINGSQGGLEDTLLIRPGDRVAQLIIEKCYDAEWKVVDQLPESVRAENGFGSSGA